MTKKVALITGANRRIGRAITQQLHTMGYCIAVHYRRGEDSAEELVKQLNHLRPDSAQAFHAALGQYDEAKALIANVFDWHNSLNVLINNASCFFPTYLDNNDDDWNNLFNSNVKAPYDLSLCASPHLKSANGNIINITDVHGTMPLKDYGLYSMTKAALVMQTKVLAKELGPDIRVNSVAPGTIAWPEGDSELTNEIKNQLINKTVLKRHGDPANIALAVKALLENDYLTGIEIPVEGGRTLKY